MVRAPTLATVKEQPPDFEDAPDPVAPPRVRASAVAAAATIAAATADEGGDTGEESASDELALAEEAAVPSGKAAGTELPAQGAHQQLLTGSHVESRNAVMIARNRGAPLTLNPAGGIGDGKDARKFDK